MRLRGHTMTGFQALLPGLLRKAVAGLVPEGAIEAHWHELKPIRFKYKAEGLDLTREERRLHGFIATQRKPRSVPR